MNTLAVNNKHSRCNMENFAQQVQTTLSQKENTFSGFFIALLKCALTLEQFERKDEYPSLIICRIMDSKRSGYLNV